MTFGSPGPVRRRAPARRRTGAVGPAGACTLLAGGARAAAAGGLFTVIDDSTACSRVEVDRTADVRQGGGSAGGDHDDAGSVVVGTAVGGAGGLRGAPRATGGER